MQQLKAFLATLADSQLPMALEVVRSEIIERALADDDPDVWAEQSFARGFDRSGWPLLPWVQGPFVIVPGAKVAKSAQSHRCRFASVEGDWVWNSALLLSDKRRAFGNGGMHCVTVLARVDGMELEVVDSKASGRAHERVKVQRIVIIGEHVAVEDTQTSRAPEHHR